MDAKLVAPSREPESESFKDSSATSTDKLKESESDSARGFELSVGVSKGNF